MSKKLRLRAWVRGGLVALVVASMLGLVPVAPAAAVQTMSPNPARATTVAAAAAPAVATTPDDCNANGTANLREPLWANRDDDGDGVCNGVDSCPDEAVATCALQAITAPADAADPSAPHLTYSGATHTMKGMLRYAPATGTTYFLWDFGDGSPTTGWRPYANPYDLSVTHVYTGAVGTRFTATLSVRNAAALSVVATDTYVVEIGQSPTGSPAGMPATKAQTDVRAAMALDAGRWYLHTRMTRGTRPEGAPGWRQPYGTWSAGALNYNTHCLGLDALLTGGSLPGGDYANDPYVEDVRRLLSVMFESSVSQAVAGEVVGGVTRNPDSDGNGRGVRLGNGSTELRLGAGCLTALAHTGSPDRIVATGLGTVGAASAIYGKTYGQIVQDAVDYLAWAQNNSGTYRGEWGYTPNDLSTPEVNGRGLVPAALAGAAAFGATVPAYVKAEHQLWLTYDQHTAPDSRNGGYGYGGPNDAYVNVPHTAGHLIGSLWVGNAPTGAPVNRGLGYLYRYWSLNNYDGGGAWNVHLGNSSAMFLTSQLMRALGVSTFQNWNYSDNSAVGAPLDWAYGYTPGAAAQNQPGVFVNLVARQIADGSWNDVVGNDAVSGQPATALAILTLGGVSPLSAPASAHLAVAPIAALSYGSASSVAIEPTTDSPAPVTFTSSTPAVCTVDGLGRATPLRSGTCTIALAQAAVAGFGAGATTTSFTVTRATPVLTYADPAAITYGTALSEDQLDAVLSTPSAPYGASPVGQTTYEVNGDAAEGLVLGAGDHTITATWTPVTGSDAQYESVSRTATLHVAKATPTITWPVAADLTAGTAIGEDHLNAEADRPGTFSYTLDDGSEPARGLKPSIGRHVLHARFVPEDADNVAGASAEAELVVAASPETPDTLGPAVQHQVDEQRVETQADLEAGQTRTLSVACPTGYLVSDGSGRVDAVDQGTGTLADVRVLESRATALDTWTVTLANRASGRAQGKVFAVCVQRETSEVDGARHALVADQTATQTRTLAGPTTVTATCAQGRTPIAPGFQLDGDAVVRRSSPDGTSSWAWLVEPTGAHPATSGTFTLRCLATRVSAADGHDHRLVVQQSSTVVGVDAGQTTELQVSCGDLARGIVGGWTLDEGLVLAGAEPRAKVRAVRLFNPTGGRLTAQLSVQCLDTRTEGGAGPVAAPAPAVAPTVSVATSSARSLTVRARGRSATRVSCGLGATSCRGTVSLVAARSQRVAGRRLARGTVLAQGRYAVRAGAAATVVLEPTRAGRRALRAPALRQARLRIGGTTRTVSLRR